MKKKHTKCVAFFLYNLSGGGIERVNINLMRELVSKNYFVDLLLVNKSGEFLNQAPAGVNIIGFNKNKAFTCLFSVAKYLWSIKPDVMLTAIPTINIVGIAANILSIFSTKVVTTEHMPVTLDEKYNASFAPKLAYKLYPFLYPFAKKIVLNCTESSKDFQKRFSTINNKKIKVIFNPVVSDEIYRLIQDKSEFQNFIDAQEDIPIILGCGRLTFQKNFELLIKSFSLVRKSLKCKLVILGQGELYRNLQELCVRLDVKEDVIFTGYVKNPYAFMARSKVFCLSSVYETLPTVLIEALTCGTNIVATDCFGVREILDDGKYGIICEDFSEEVMSKAILQSLQQDKKYNNHHSLKLHIEKFSSKESAKKYLDLIEEITS